MWQEDRHQRIRALLSTLQRVSTERIMADLGVSRETVRRDLLDLEALGELRRVHGGAIKPADEAPIAERAHIRVKSKTAIAKAAIGVIASGQTLFIDAGTTTSALAEELAKLANLTVVTNSIDVALKMRGATEQQAEAANEVILLGGSISDRAMATGGSTTILEIHRYRADMALLSPVGIDHAARRYQLRSRRNRGGARDGRQRRPRGRSSPITARSASAAAFRTARPSRSTC